jgi:3-hydroxyacyl-CoA dehydrogenase/enoyl-CoA hydratase/3-hydroxybutyryl-CoA epimerase
VTDDAATLAETISWERDGNGVVLLTLDDPARSANTMNEAYLRSMDVVLDRLYAEQAAISGVIITSAKKTFFAGGDLTRLITATADQAAEVSAVVTRAKAQLRRLETFGRPVVAAINGSALGGGLELALACHYRVASDAPGVEIGLPEVTLGLLPGTGGVVRTVRLLGIAEALTQVLLRGQRHRPAKALQIGLVHELAPVADLLDRARGWIADHPAPAQPWDVKGFRIPGGTPSSPSFAAMLPAFPANLRKELKGAPYPAPHHILCAAIEGAQVDLDTALAVEGRYFVDLVCGQVSKNMIQAFFFDLQAANAPRTAGAPVRPATRVAVLGAGMMGAAIAYVCAKAGIEVVLKDVTAEAAGRGKEYSAGLVGKAVERGRTSAEDATALLDRIRPTADVADVAGCDLVIEAVFEDPALKHRVFAEVEPVLAADALLASNTSTLPITQLATGVRRPEDFVGLHFFSPVDKMPLVEVIRGEKTSDETLGRALDVVRQIRKTPIVVNDSRGFFTSRVIGTFSGEGLAMLAEGLHPASIEQASSQAGYPAPVLALLDELTLTLPRKIRDQTAAAVRAAGGEWLPSPADGVLDRMVEEFARPGRSGGAGFYSYVDGKRAGLWPGLVEHFVKPGASIPFADMQERMLFAEALETVKCLDEGVLTSVADANIGSILGIGFPGWTGGVLQYINQYDGGLPGFIARARELADRYGDRFTPPPALLARAERSETFR